MHPEHSRPVYFDEAGFAASSPIQYGWGPRGYPHRVEPQDHCRRSVPWALDHGSNTLFYSIKYGSITRAVVTDFLPQVARQGDDRLTILVPDNAPVHRGIDDQTRKRGFFGHTLCLLYLPAYNCGSVNITSTHPPE